MAEEVSYSPERTAYLEEKHRMAMVLHTDHFVLLCHQKLSTIPMAGAAAYRSRLDENDEGILINWDYYQSSLGQDFTDCLDFEIEHEAQELWLIKGKTEVDPFGPDHYEAIRCALRLAAKRGMLERYLELKRAQFKMFAAMGDDRAMEELAFYREFADSMKK